MFELSEYQKAILDNIKNTNDNLLIEAKAGSGKTSTLLLIAEELIKQNKKSLFLAFTKNVVKELQGKLDTNNCNVKTLHSIGRSFVYSYLYKKYGKDGFIVNTLDNNLELVKNLLESDGYLAKIKERNSDLPEADFKELLYHIQSELSKFIDYCRFYLIDFNNEELIEEFVFSVPVRLENITGYKELDLELGKFVKTAINTILDKFENPRYDEKTNQYVFYITFTDMVFLPVYYNMKVPYSLSSFLDYVEVDEAQDQSILGQTFIKNLLHNWNNTTRYIFVGDRRQAIYGFAGADTGSMDNIKSNFSLKELPLNICYRCPEKIIRLAQTIVPTIEWNKSREDLGDLFVIDSNSLENILQPGDMIVGRKNKDLLELYRHLALDKKIKIKFKNQVIVEILLNGMKTSISNYIIKYNRGENVEIAVKNELIVKDIPLIQKDRTPEQLQYVQDFVKQQVKEMIDSHGKIIRSGHKISYLLKAMNEYKSKGAYNVSSMQTQKDDTLCEYFRIIKSFVYEYLIEKYSLNRDYILENKSLIDDRLNVYYDKDLVKDFVSYLADFLHGSDYETNCPIISTIHSVKGEEADRVFILDYPEFPYYFRNMSKDQEEQEKNLQYVAITRAKKSLFLIRINTSNMENISKIELAEKSNDMCDYIVSKINGIIEERKQRNNGEVSEFLKDNPKIKNMEDINNLIIPRKYDTDYFNNKMI